MATKAQKIQARDALQRKTGTYLGCEYVPIYLDRESLDTIGKRLPLLGYFESHVTGVRKFLKSDSYMICRDDYGALPVFVNQTKMNILTDK